MNEEFEEMDSEEAAQERRVRWNLKDPKVIAASAAGALLLAVGAFAVWYFVSGGESGTPVAAPRDTGFGPSQETGSGQLAPDRKLVLTDDQLKAAGLEFAVVGETMDGVSLTSSTTGVVRANEYAATPVNSLVGGVVKEIRPELGEFVRRGETIAVVSSEELATTQSKYLSMKAELDEAEKRYKRALQLSDISEEARNDLDRATAALQAAEAMLAEKRSNHERSKKLVEIGAVSRKEFEKVTTEFETAKANLTEAESRFERSRKLLEIDPARRNELDQFLTKVRTMQADSASMREKLLVLGLSKKKVDDLRSADQVSSLLPILSPISGTLTERKINRGEVVSATSQIGTVTDLSKVWVIGQVYEKDLGKIKVGSGASVRSDSYPDELFRGSVTYVDPALDTETRTAQVRVELDNPGEKLKLGMYVNIAFATLGGSEKTVPLVPKDAVQTIGSGSVVFLSTDDPRTFLMRQIRIGNEIDGAYPVLEGLFVGDKVVTNGSFLLKAEWLKTNPPGI